VGIFPKWKSIFFKKIFLLCCWYQSSWFGFWKVEKCWFSIDFNEEFKSIFIFMILQGNDHNKQIKKCIRMMFTHYKIFSALKSVRELNTIFVWGRSKSFLISNWIGERGSRIVVGGILVGGLGNRIFWYVFFPENPIFWYAKLDNNVAHIITVRLERAARTRLIYRT